MDGIQRRRRATLALLAPRFANEIQRRASLSALVGNAGHAFRLLDDDEMPILVDNTKLGSGCRAARVGRGKTPGHSLAAYQPSRGVQLSLSIYADLA